MGSTLAQAKCITAVRAFDLLEMSRSISGPGVEGGGRAEGEEGGRREGGKPHGQISQTGKPPDSYWISSGSVSLGVVKVTPGPPRQSCTSSLPSGWCRVLWGCRAEECGESIGCCTGASDLGWRGNAAVLNMHSPSYRISIIRLLFGLSHRQQEFCSQDFLFFICFPLF